VSSYAHLVKFEKDIFISYAHIDDQVFGAEEEGWITKFHKSLEVRLSQLMGSKPRIWRDPKLQGNDYFGDEIVDQFPDVALILSIVSPRYVKSEWCIREIETFAKVAAENGGVRVNNKSRIFKVIKTHVPFDEHPEEMKDLLGYEFYKVEPETNRAREFSPVYGPESERAYWMKLDDVAHDIAAILEELESVDAEPVQQTEEMPSGLRITAEDKEVVYLAETSSDLAEERDILKRELQGQGYEVLPSQHMPYIKADAEQMIIESLQKSVLSIHPIGGHYGFVPEGTDKSIVHLQNEIAADMSKSNKLSRFIWLPPGNIVSENEDGKLLKSFISLIQTDADAQVGADLFETPMKDVKFAILDKLAQLKRQKEQAQPHTQAMPDQMMGELPLVYLICDQRDLDHTMVVEDYLFDSGYEVLTPAFEGDEMQLRQDHQENLKLCDATLIYFGAGNELWMRAKQRDLLKIAGYGRAKPLKAKGIYLGEQNSTQAQRVRSRDSIIIDGLKGFSPDLMEPFVNRIKSVA